MHIFTLATPLAELDTQKVMEISRSAWVSQRPTDTYCALPFVAGTQLGVQIGSLQQVYAHLVKDLNLAQADSTRLKILWSHESLTLYALPDATHGFLDLSVYAGNTKLELAGSTAFLGDAILAAITAGLTTLHIHCPQFLQPTDLGIGMLGAISGRELEFRRFSTATNLTDIASSIRKKIHNLHIIFTYDYPLPLLGLQGMAHAWSVRGYDMQKGQELEYLVSSWTRALDKEFSSSLLLNSSPHKTSFAGVGGGLGYLFSLLGCGIWVLDDYLLSDFAYGNRIQVEINRADLVLYITGNIRQDLPLGLNAITQRCEEAALPCVLLSNSAGFRRGDLPRYGLSGSYELRSDMAYLPDKDVTTTPFTGTEALLTQRIQQLANTWGW